MNDDIDAYSLFRMAKRLTAQPMRPENNVLRAPLARRWTWPMNLTQDDREFLKQIKVKADA